MGGALYDLLQCLLTIRLPILVHIGMNFNGGHGDGLTVHGVFSAHFLCSVCVCVCVCVHACVRVCVHACVCVMQSMGTAKVMV